MKLLSRRELVQSAVASGLAYGLVDAAAEKVLAKRAKIKAVAFDAFPIFDPRPIYALVDELYPGKGGELSAAWRTRQFEYGWLRALSKQYVDFWKVTEDALVFAAKASRVELDRERREQIMSGFLRLKPWPDVPEALAALRDSGVRLGFLSNFSPKMLEACIGSSGLEGTFEHILSTDRAATYKPDRGAYQLGVDAFRLKREEILFAAFAGWDAAGAKAFGYPTYWVNRQNQPVEELGFQADAVGANLKDLVEYLKADG